MIAVSLFKEEEEEESYSTIIMVNPKILDHSDSTCIDEE
jgi:peptide deformylase